MADNNFFGNLFVNVTESAQQLFNKTTEYVFSIKWEDLPEDIKTYIRENPGQAGMHVVGGVVFFAPALITGPLLGLLGFTAVGPAAGSIAAAWQAFIGPVAARGFFATLQSAAMGGYGAPIVGSIVRAVAAWGFAGWKRNGTETGGNMTGNGMGNEPVM
ncbi:uncharacterized protein J3D65DRAFT_600890 [Phyllosticta citribraziliensis]|uniref:Uncharacterized protein n=1 Tax=Phyllosticta citribraziliensis TaxID=989973 RepID=A0ABR1LZZ5_9PEZI